VCFLIPGSHAPNTFRARPNVRFPGYVRDTRELYHRPNTIVAAPLFSGTGQRVKLLEAFSMACPVVTTSVGASGFPIQSGAEAFIADNAHEFERSIHQLLSSVDLRRQMGAKGREMIVRQFNWDRIGAELLRLVETGSK
jgi:polysaccharide biosynthesis protein PslH